MKRINREVLWPLVTWSRDFGGIRANYALRPLSGSVVEAKNPANRPFAAVRSRPLEENQLCAT
jgi:hypothetical protein